MPDQDANNFKQQLDEVALNVRNEMIIQTANVVIFGQTAVRAGVGLALLGVDEAQAILHRAVDRGEIAEGDAQKVLDDLRAQALARADEANQARVDLTNKASIALSANVEQILKSIGIAGLLPKGK